MLNVAEFRFNYEMEGFSLAALIKKLKQQSHFSQVFPRKCLNTQSKQKHLYRTMQGERYLLKKHLSSNLLAYQWLI